VRRASDAERERLHDTFVALCRVESPSGRERPCTDHVARELTQIGLAVEEDDAGPSAGANAGNRFARIPGRGDDSMLLCAHLDTVPPTAPIEPILIDGGWTNAGDGIIGADNKAAVAVMLELARRLTNAGEPPEAGIELLFTVSEENGLHGANAFDVSRLRSTFGFVFDHATPIGEIVIGSPTYQRVVAELHGRAAHAGLRPEEGRNAIAAAAAAIASIRPTGPGDDVERRDDLGRHGDERRARALPRRGRGAWARRSARRGGADRDDRSLPGCRRCR
jgi:tripeptide aminopeptidase